MKKSIKTLLALSYYNLKLFWIYFFLHSYYF